MDNVPRIRFSKFAGKKWPDMKLSELGEMMGRSTSNKPTSDFMGASLEFMGASLITRPNAFHHRILKADDFEYCEQDEKADQVMNGDVIFTTSGGKENDVAVASVVISTPDWPLYFGDFLVLFRPNREFDPHYLSAALEAPKVRARLNDLSQMGTSLANIKKSDIASISIPVPPLEIQHKIGDALAIFDEPIAELEAHQKQLNAYKNWSMQNLFI